MIGGLFLLISLFNVADSTRAYAVYAPPQQQAEVFMAEI